MVSRNSYCGTGHMPESLLLLPQQTGSYERGCRIQSDHENVSVIVTSQFPGRCSDNENSFMKIHDLSLREYSGRQQNLLAGRRGPQKEIPSAKITSRPLANREFWLTMAFELRRFSSTFGIRWRQTRRSFVDFSVTCVTRSIRSCSIRS
jgi:hypothetical protein